MPLWTCQEAVRPGFSSDSWMLTRASASRGRRVSISSKRTSRMCDPSSGNSPVICNVKVVASTWLALMVLLSHTPPRGDRGRGAFGWTSRLSGLFEDAGRCWIIHVQLLDGDQLAEGAGDVIGEKGAHLDLETSCPGEYGGPYRDPGQDESPPRKYRECQPGDTEGEEDQTRYKAEYLAHSASIAGTSRYVKWCSRPSRTPPNHGWS